MAEGIRARHQRKCRSRDGGRCNCKPGWEAWVYLSSDERTPEGRKREGRKLRKTFRDKSEASSWRIDAKRAVNRGELASPTKITVAEAIAEWFAAARQGVVLARHDEPYRDRTLYGLERHAERHIIPELGARRLSEIKRNDVTAFANRLIAAGKSPSTVRNVLAPLGAVYRWYADRGVITVNPVAAYKRPRVTSRRERFASPDEAMRLIAAIPKSDRPLWATAFYTGLRLSELRGLRWRDVDLARGVLRVERTVDDQGRVGKPKSKAGRRRVPIIPRLRDELVEHRLHGAPADPDHLRPLRPPHARERGRGSAVARELLGGFGERGRGHRTGRQRCHWRRSWRTDVGRGSTERKELGLRNRRSQVRILTGALLS
jgi:integrase